MTTLASGSSVTFGLAVDQTFEMTFADGTTGTITVTGPLGSPYRTTFGPAKKNNWMPLPLGTTGQVVVACTAGSVSYTLGASSFVTAVTDAVTGVSVAPPILVAWNGTNDSVAIDAAIELAGIGGAIAFIPKKTYLTRGGHELLSGQTVYGNGATVKKMPQATSVLKTGTTYAAAARTVDVETPGNFAVGMWVQVTSPLSALVAESTYYTTASAYKQCFAAKVVSVVGNTVTVDRTMDIYTDGTMVLSAANGALLAENAPIFFAGKNWSDYPAVAWTWATAPTNIKIFDLTFDGDRLNNTEGAWWVSAATLEMDAHYTQVQRCRFQNIASDAVLVSGKSIRVLDCHFDTIDGNCTHPGAYQSTSATNGTEDFQVRGCSARDVLKTYKRGHGYGAFIFSNYNLDPKIADCHVDTCNGYAFAYGMNNTDARLALTGCTAKNVVGGAFRAVSSASIAINGCVFKNCKEDTLATLPNGGNTTAQILTSTAITITGCVFEDSPLAVNETPGQCIISGNSFYAPTLVQPASGAYSCMLNTSASGVTGHIAITGNTFSLKPGDSTALNGIGNSSSGTISGNTFYGGAYGVRYVGSAVNCDITGNTFVDQYTIAAELRNNGTTLSPSVNFIGNIVKLSAAGSAAATWVGVKIDNYNATLIGPVTVMNNTIESLRATNTAYGIHFTNASNASQKCTIIGNKITVTNAGDETVIAATNLDNTSLVAGNRVSKAVHASISTAGIVTGLTGNLVM